jgi:hypothetical protein
MISPFAYARFQREQYGEDSHTISFYNLTVHRQIPKEHLTEEEFAICTPFLLGFSFDRKTWGEDFRLPTLFAWLSAFQVALLWID